MNEEKFQATLDRLNREKDTLARLWHSGLAEHVAHVYAYRDYDVDMHMEQGEIEARRAAMVREFGPDRLDDYYLASEGLAIVYLHSDNVRVIYYDHDAEERLASLSDGKCKITRETVESIAEQIICARPE